MAMTPYQRIFGSGPRGSALSLATLGLALLVDRLLETPPLHSSSILGITALLVCTGLTAIILVWSVRALPPETRGREFVKTGPYRYVRHPVYAAFLGPFDLGLVIFLDAWPYLVWAVAQYPLWHWNIAAEERLMTEAFGQDYADYCRRTPRFLPKPAALAGLLR
jgi:protein-S-isoprenylcysteine O-methyltransferase Ste14